MFVGRWLEDGCMKSSLLGSFTARADDGTGKNVFPEWDKGKVLRFPGSGMEV
jgi:hypothetical protein